MSIINVLDKNVAELIAAGEVVERPSSVVKELVENSIDSGAKNIIVEIKNGGTTLIKVTDDGCGISREDVSKAFLRHATSKVKDESDLESISTLGFRGEALASICAVSRVELITRTENEVAGTHYKISAGEEGELHDIGCACGTTILVKDLFYNVPARIKFLKSDASEANAIAGLLDRMSLSHPEISFRFVKEDKEYLNTPGNNDVKSTIYSVFGKDFTSSLQKVNYEINNVKVFGYISSPNKVRANRSMQYFFVNGRYVKSKTAMIAMEQAYKGNIMTGKFPACVLYIELACEATDVNVHPSKLEIRFINEKPVFDAVFYGVKNSLVYDNKKPIMSLNSSNYSSVDNTLVKDLPNYGKTNMPKVNLNSFTIDYNKEENKKFKNIDGSKEQESILNSLNSKLPIKSKDSNDGLDIYTPSKSAYNSLKLNDVDLSEDFYKENKIEISNDLLAHLKKDDDKSLNDSVNDFTILKNKVNLDDMITDGNLYFNSEYINVQDDEEPIISSINVNNQDSTNTIDINNKDREEPLTYSIDINNKNGEELLISSIDIDDKNSEETIITDINVNKQDAEEQVINNIDVYESLGINSEKEEIHQEQIPNVISDNEISSLFIGQLFDTYILLQNNNELILVDKHAAHERLIYEKLKNENVESFSQSLISPITITLDKKEHLAIIGNLDRLLKVGFEIEEFGSSVVIVRSAPSYIDINDIPSSISEIASYILDNRKSLNTEYEDWVYHNIACRAAIKAGKKDSNEELMALVDMLNENPSLSHCPHGRPISIVIKKSEIEKQFGRIV